MNQKDFLNTFEKRKYKPRQNYSARDLSKTHLYQRIYGFNCSFCHAYVSSDVEVSGVLNRNQCPYCLFSKHVDLYQSGDRLSACKALMRPVGLTLKKSNKKYGSDQGELMIIHLCTYCDDISINRIAADDDVNKLMEIYQSSSQLDSSTKLKLNQQGIRLLATEDHCIVHRRLFGQNTPVLTGGK